MSLVKLESSRPSLGILLSSNEGLIALTQLVEEDRWKLDQETLPEFHHVTVPGSISHSQSAFGQVETM